MNTMLEERKAIIDANIIGTILAACRRDRGLRQVSPWRWLAKAPVRRFGRSAGRTLGGWPAQRRRFRRFHGLDSVLTATVLRSGRG
jgi:hypothetical protein